MAHGSARSSEGELLGGFGGYHRPIAERISWIEIRSRAGDVEIKPGYEPPDTEGIVEAEIVGDEAAVTIR